MFERPFRGKLIDDEKYLKNLILYIHQNPINHNVADTIEDYPWSSYKPIISSKPTKIKRDFVLDLFGKKTNFIFVHEQSKDDLNLENW